MSSIKIDVDFKALDKAFARLPIETERSLGNRMKNAMTKVAVSAKSPVFHRYKTKGGFLDKSPQVTKDTNWKHGEVQLELGVAPYARRIHEGGGGLLDSLGRRMTNKPDQFLYAAFKTYKDNIMKSLRAGITTAINKAGL